jgi:phage-related protein
MTDRKPVEFRGSSLDDLRAFPVPARREAGHQVDQVQQGREPDDWKPSFQKKTQKTSKTDLDLAEKRYRDLTKELAP